MINFKLETLQPNRLFFLQMKWWCHLKMSAMLQLVNKMSPTKCYEKNTWNWGYVIIFVLDLQTIRWNNVSSSSYELLITYFHDNPILNSEFQKVFSNQISLVCLPISFSSNSILLVNQFGKLQYWLSVKIWDDQFTNFIFNPRWRTLIHTKSL